MLPNPNPGRRNCDYENNIVEVPATGVSDMKLAFVSDTRIDISATEGTDSGVNLSEMSVSEETEGIVSAFNVSVAAQGSGRLGYTILVHLKNALLSGSYDYVEIRVAPSDKQIETVEMGGSIWMAFNARSRDLEDQVYPLDGATVEEMYRNGWVSSIGGLFQYGRKYMYTPWQGYNPSNNLGNQTADIPWQNDTHMPCPEGLPCATRQRTKLSSPQNQENSRHLYSRKRRKNNRYTPRWRRNPDYSNRCNRNATLCEIYF